MTLTRIVQHHRYYIFGGDVVFLIQNVLFRVHSFFLTRESDFFCRLLESSPARGRRALDSEAVHLEDYLQPLDPEQFEAFLWVFYNERFSLYKAPVERWLQILRLSFEWQFPEVKALAIRELEKQALRTAVRIGVYHEYEVDRQLLIACYVDLCIRKEIVTDEEAEMLDMTTVLRIWRIREFMLRSNMAPLPEDAERLVREVFDLPAGEDDDSTEQGTQVNDYGPDLGDTAESSSEVDVSDMIWQTPVEEVAPESDSIPSTFVAPPANTLPAPKQEEIKGPETPKQTPKNLPQVVVTPAVQTQPEPAPIQNGVPAPKLAVDIPSNAQPNGAKVPNGTVSQAVSKTANRSSAFSKPKDPEPSQAPPLPQVPEPQVAAVPTDPKKTPATSAKAAPPPPVISAPVKEKEIVQPPTTVPVKDTVSPLPVTAPVKDTPPPPPITAPVKDAPPPTPVAPVKDTPLIPLVPATASLKDVTPPPVTIAATAKVVQSPVPATASAKDINSSAANEAQAKETAHPPASAPAKEVAPSTLASGASVKATPSPPVKAEPQTTQPIADPLQPVSPAPPAVNPQKVEETNKKPVEPAPPTPMVIDPATPVEEPMTKSKKKRTRKANTKGQQSVDLDSSRPTTPVAPAKKVAFLDQVGQSEDVPPVATLANGKDIKADGTLTPSPLSISSQDKVGSNDKPEPTPKAAAANGAKPSSAPEAPKVEAKPAGTANGPVVEKKEDAKGVAPKKDGEAEEKKDDKMSSKQGDAKATDKKGDEAVKSKAGEEKSTGSGKVDEAKVLETKTPNPASPPAKEETTKPTTPDPLSSSNQPSPPIVNKTGSTKAAEKSSTSEKADAKTSETKPPVPASQASGSPAATAGPSPTPITGAGANPEPTKVEPSKNDSATKAEKEVKEDKNTSSKPTLLSAEQKADGTAKPNDTNTTKVNGLNANAKPAEPPAAGANAVKNDKVYSKPKDTKSDDPAKSTVSDNKTTTTTPPSTNPPSNSAKPNGEAPNKDGAQTSSEAANKPTASAESEKTAAADTKDTKAGTKDAVTPAKKDEALKTAGPEAAKSSTAAAATPEPPKDGSAKDPKASTTQSNPAPKQNNAKGSTPEKDSKTQEPVASPAANKEATTEKPASSPTLSKGIFGMFDKSKGDEGKKNDAKGSGSRPASPTKPGSRSQSPTKNKEGKAKPGENADSTDAKNLEVNTSTTDAGKDAKKDEASPDTPAAKKGAYSSSASLAARLSKIRAGKK